MCICNVFFFFSSQNKRRRRRRTGKKSATQSSKLCILFSYKKNSDILISGFTIAWSTPMTAILATVIGKIKNNKTKQKRKYKSRTTDLQLYSTKFWFWAISLLLPNFIFYTYSFLKCFPLLLIYSPHFFLSPVPLI